ncbi:hypothetical protein IC229_14225 [Spirosoma sp. BT702]|uniref:CBM3 domain-containing protein n=1 Tax=Spirosoma profusum TaxID=2771354 RepID=A0A927ANG5_9BACT|nr:cellulose binding domain-containing protein [Spirosoma profusum]MBD2701804.1 hypothetical protein [Spirosoma profusum]
MRYFFHTALLGLFIVCLFTLSALAQLSPPGLVSSHRATTTRAVTPVQRIKQIVDSLQRLTRPGYYSALFAAKKRSSGSPGVRIAADDCNGSLCNAIIDTSLSVGLTYSGALNCSTNSVTLTAFSSQTTTGTYIFKGPDGIISSGPSKTAVVTKVGDYTVTLSVSSGQSVTDVATITEDYAAPSTDLIATNNGILTCAQTLVTLTGISVDTLRLDGPGGIVIGVGRVTVSQAGTYSLTLTGYNGCTAVTSTTIGQDIAAPTVSINPPTGATLTCASPTVSLSAVGEGSYLWSTGDSTSVISVDTAGTYSVILTGANGCTATASSTVEQNVSTPSLSIVPSSATLTCASPTASLSAVGNGTYLWSTGDSTPSISVSVAATYSVTLTGASGCVATDSITIEQNLSVPSISITSSSTTLTCASPTASLLAVGSGAYKWSTGATTQSISVSIANTYSVTLTAENGCTSIANVSIGQNADVPTVSITPNSATLTCSIPSVSLSAVGTGTYLWSTGATTSAISVTSAGPYSVTLTAANGCTATASQTVIQGGGAPSVSISAPAGTTLTCATSSVSLSVVGTGTYKWSTGATSSVISVTTAATYSVTLTSSNGCSSMTSIVVGQDKNAPVVSITPNSATLTCASPSVSLSVVGTGTVLWSTGATTRSISVSLTGDYTVALKAPNGCQAVATVTVSQNKTDPTVSINPATATLSCSTSAVSLSAVGSGTYRWSTGATTQIISATSATTYSVTLTGVNGCTAIASRVVSSSNNLTAPTLQASAQTTVNQPISVTAIGCSGTINWQTQGGNGQANGSIYTFTQPGSYTLSATCKLGTCTSPAASVTMAIQTVTAGLKVLHQNADYNQLQNSTVKPNLQLQNDGSTPISYSEITVRYWFTAEQFSPMTNLSVYYAQLGTDKVKMKYVELPQPRQGALGYVEYSFLATAGNLGTGQNSGQIQTSIAKQDWTNFSESDDYSFANNSGYLANTRITAYRNGNLVWGTEPLGVSTVQSLKSFTENKNSVTTNSIGTFLQIRNEGNVAVNYSDVKVRYYFTLEGNQTLNFYVDYAVLGNGNVKGRFVKPSPPLANADTYLELSFVNIGKLYPLSSTGNIQYRIAKADWSNFSQSNDHSYQNGTNPMGENNRVVIYLGSQRVYGVEPGQGAREGVNENVSALQVTVLGNPVQGSEVGVEVRGAEGQPLQFQLTDVTGRLLSTKTVEIAGYVEQQRLSLGGVPAGSLLLQVSTLNQQQTVRVIKER